MGETVASRLLGPTVGMKTVWAYRLTHLNCSSPKPAGLSRPISRNVGSPRNVEFGQVGWPVIALSELFHESRYNDRQAAGVAAFARNPIRPMQVVPVAPLLSSPAFSLMLSEWSPYDLFPDAI